MHLSSKKEVKEQATCRENPTVVFPLHVVIFFLCVYLRLRSEVNRQQQREKWGSGGKGYFDSSALL